MKQGDLIQAARIRRAFADGAEVAEPLVAAYQQARHNCEQYTHSLPEEPGVTSLIKRRANMARRAAAVAENLVVSRFEGHIRTERSLLNELSKGKIRRKHPLPEEILKKLVEAFRMDLRECPLPEDKDPAPNRPQKKSRPGGNTPNKPKT